jgi:hypothetical protein
VKSATLQTSKSPEGPSAASVTIPWSHGSWKFIGKEKPLAGTLVIVEDTPEGPLVVGTTTAFYDLSLADNKK